ncbi:hypothetical protein C8R48DRAFT_696654 [Suillus tomentosus]|nr:hypothetical protein C8R48DRAFT_696654 [Suillus tomentosus]
MPANAAMPHSIHLPESWLIAVTPSALSHPVHVTIKHPLSPRTSGLRIILRSY